ncbi:MAG: hypothetical protein H6581_31090 [Bacteroidia bacterium]|nr:hypothetical protein [Bacteroidia bacterium]
MKKLLCQSLFFFALLFCLSFSVNAQTTTSAGSVSGPTQQQVQTPPPSIPISYVYRVLYEAQTPLNTPFQVLLTEYYNKNCKVTCIAIYPNGDMTFKVQYGGGGDVIISIEGDVF